MSRRAAADNTLIKRAVLPGRAIATAPNACLAVPLWERPGAAGRKR